MKNSDECGTCCQKVVTFVTMIITSLTEMNPFGSFGCGGFSSSGFVRPPETGHHKNEKREEGKDDCPKQIQQTTSSRQTHRYSESFFHKPRVRHDIIGTTTIMIPTTGRMLMRYAMKGQLSAMLPKQSRSLFTPTIPLLEKVTIKVPTMGDSITEGTIVEWTVSVGQAVKEDDVVALVETDKVTVEIKAERDGVVVQQFGAVDDTVEVGANLYEIDTEAEATVTASATGESAPSQSAAPTETTPEAPPPPPPEAPAATAASEQGRKPLIQFLGKEGWAARLSGQPPTPQVLIPDKPHGAITLDGSMIDALYGRPVISDREMEALISGGADIAPAVVSQSTGAKFSM
eukprot:CAMPEP_0116868966 /NCGR_PEP_ID=MMETSP0418-20121206/27498_1 /TAXON_ID=1158023 /ORGANISM="Astrosyne radiata, Strain 13vi08-1A" /LENGTH=345 /DNA_ID=CAMNT_0004505011 /DNA_START=600 /DNA_END=1637 /DNA_ORIENTATION=+